MFWMLSADRVKVSSFGSPLYRLVCTSWTGIRLDVEMRPELVVLVAVGVGRLVVALRVVSGA